MGKLRIVAGEFRGRRIRTPDGDHVRPTPDRVREALFDILGETVHGVRVLDAWAGSGALGFEALSRGARHVTFIESDPAAIRMLRDNIRQLAVADRCDLLAGPVESWPRDRTIRARPVDLVLADPPYGESRTEILELVAGSGWLRAGGRLVLESDARAEPAAADRAGFVLRRSARYGRSRLDFYAFQERPERP